MQFDNQIVTRELQIDEIWAALQAVLSRFAEAKIKEIEILFGWGWPHKEPEWGYVPCSLSEIESRIIAAEQEGPTGNQTLGRSDVFLRHPQLPFEVQFCHELDLHICLERSVPLIAAILADWLEKGLNPRLFVKENDVWVEGSISTFL